jgi:hypothetical protein
VNSTSPKRDSTPSYQCSACYLAHAPTPRQRLLNQDHNSKPTNPKQVHQPADEQQQHQHPTTAETEKAVPHTIGHGAPGTLAPVL